MTCRSSDWTAAARERCEAATKRSYHRRKDVLTMIKTDLPRALDERQEYKDEAERLRAAAQALIKDATHSSGALMNPSVSVMVRLNDALRADEGSDDCPDDWSAAQASGSTDGGGPA